MFKDLSSDPFGNKPARQTAVDDQDTSSNGVFRAAQAYMLIFGTVSLFLAAQIIVGVLVSLALILTGVDADSLEESFTNPYILLATGILIDAILIGGLYYAYKLMLQNFWQSIQLTRNINKQQITSALGYYAVYFLGFGMLWWFVQQFIPAIDTEQTQNIGFDAIVGYEYIATFVALVVLPPIAEEIVFRGVLYTRLKSYINPRLALLITSVIFAAAHLELLGGGSPNWIAALDTFVLSIVLILALERTKTLWAPIVIHAVKNGIAFVVVFLL